MPDRSNEKRARATRTLVGGFMVVETAGGLAPLAGAWAAPVPTGSAEGPCRTEYGACPMAFQPELLPARSWVALMAGLNNQFAENAMLDADTDREILACLRTPATDAAGSRSYHDHVLRSLPASETLLRITDTPYWICEYRREIAASAFANPKVKSRANGVACPRGRSRAIMTTTDRS